MNDKYMKLKYYTVGLVLFSVIGTTANADRLIFPLLRLESQSNIVVTAGIGQAVGEHRIPCPPEYTNLLSNTNLFSTAEVQRLKAIPLKYKSITTNSGPAGAIFKGMVERQWRFGNRITTFRVSCFAYTNFNAWEEISISGAEETMVNFRLESGDGYNVQLSDGRNARVIRYEEYKNGVLDGLYVSQGFDEDHCTMWARFVRGKIVGKFISWNHYGQIDAEAEFKEPFDFLKYAVGKADMSWDKVPTTQTNSVPNRP
jgi:hypothetical protein